MLNKFKGLIAVSLVTFAAGCSGGEDVDGGRAGAIQIPLEQVASDELNPSGGDDADWKMIFIPAPGDIVVNTFWDQPKEIFNVELGVYDRFGIPLSKVKRDSSASNCKLRVFSPEGGLHYVKISADSGQSIYSLNVGYEENDEGYMPPATPPTYEAYANFEAEAAANAKANKAKAKQQAAAAAAAASSGGGAGGGMAAGGGGMAAGGGMPMAAGGGMPMAAGGGMPMAMGGGMPMAMGGGMPMGGGDFDPEPPSGGRKYKSSEVRTLNQKSSAVSTTSKLKPICDDIKGSFKTINADIMSVSSKKTGTEFKLSAGKKDGVADGAVGEIYIGGKILDGGRFKVTKILPTSCIAETNAKPEDVKRAEKFVIKSPD